MNQIDLSGVGNPSITAAPCISLGRSFLESAMDTKVCTKCGIEKPVLEFYKRNDRKSGRQSHCDECSKARVAEYRLTHIESITKRKYEYNRTHKVKIAIYDKIYAMVHSAEKKAYMLRYKNQYPGRRKAKAAVSNAILVGKLSRPTKCSKCDRTCKPEGHHWSYIEEHWLDVDWLCVSCHRRLHAKLKKEERCQ